MFSKVYELVKLVWRKASHQMRPVLVTAWWEARQELQTRTVGGYLGTTGQVKASGLTWPKLQVSVPASYIMIECS